MFKNVASQKLTVFAFDSTTNLPKTGDAANITAYVDKDDGGVTVLADTSATEKDATNAKGYYIFDLAQAETNGDKLLFSAKSSTSNIVVIGVPAVVSTMPPNFTNLVIDGTGRVNAFLIGILTSVFTEGAAGRIAAAFKQFFNIATPAATMDHLILVDTASTLTNAPPDSSGTTTLLSRLSAARAGYLDNLNVGGAVASHADFLAINQSASKHLLLQTVGQYERPESSSTVYTIEMRTFAAADGAAVNADSTPTLTATGQTSGSLAANLSAATNPATGVYRWTYTVASGATNEPIRFDGSATISSSTFTLSCYSQVVDEVAVTFTATNQSHLEAIYNKLPTNNIADETLVLAAIGTPMQATSGERTAIANAHLDLTDGVETGKTPRQALRLIAASAAGKRSNAGTVSEQYDAIGNPGTARIVGNLDSAGNGTPTLTP